MSFPAVFLAPFGMLYGAGWLAYKLVYDLGLKKPQERHIPVVCVGSLLAGGAGKTPVTRHVAEVLAAMGRKPAIAMSGYRSQNRRGAALAPEGPLDPAVWGDETTVMRDLLPDVPLAVGKDRVLAARAVHAAHPDHVLLLDDGFQHLPLKKHVQIVLDPPRQSNRLPLPAGPYREVWSLGRRRADLVLPNSEMTIRARKPAFLLSGVQEVHAPARAQLLCAIARPYRIQWTLERLGVEVVKGRNLEDHASLDGASVLAGLDRRLPVVTTYKDWVKLRARPDLEGWTFLVLRHEVTIEPAEAFQRWLAARLDRLNP